MGGAFVGGGATESYELISEYERKHRYDPIVEWIGKEENILVRKVGIDPKSIVSVVLESHNLFVL